MPPNVWRPQLTARRARNRDGGSAKQRVETLPDLAHPALRWAQHAHCPGHSLRSPEAVIIIHMLFNLLTSCVIISSFKDEKPEIQTRNLPEIPESVQGWTRIPTLVRFQVPRVSLVCSEMAPPGGVKCRFPGATPAHGLRVPAGAGSGPRLRLQAGSQGFAASQTPSCILLSGLFSGPVVRPVHHPVHHTPSEPPLSPSLIHSLLPEPTQTPVF